MTAIENVFGANCKIHPVTKRPLEDGIGHLPEEKQVELHLFDIEREEGKAVADAMRAEMKAIKDKAEADHQLAVVTHEESHG